MGAWRPFVMFHLMIFFTIVYSDECDRKITRQKFYGKDIQTVQVENHFGEVLVRKHDSESEARILVEVNLVGTLLHAANLPIVFSDNGGKAVVMVSPLAEDSSTVKLSLFSAWMLSLPLIAGLIFQRRAFALVILMLFSIWMSVTVAQDGCPTGDVEVFMPRNSCFSVAHNQDGRSTSVDFNECEVENQPQVVACSVSGYLYLNCTEGIMCMCYCNLIVVISLHFIGSRGILLSWNVMFSAATNNTLAMADSPILIEWGLKAVDCRTCPMVTSFATILEFHEVG